MDKIFYGDLVRIFINCVNMCINDWIIGDMIKYLNVGFGFVFYLFNR